MSSQGSELLDVECPCCKAKLRVDPATAAVITFEEPVKPPTVSDLQEAVQKLKGESARRDEVFQKNLAAHRSQQEVLAKKFDELFKKAKESPDSGKPVRDIDLD